MRTTVRPGRVLVRVCAEAEKAIANRIPVAAHGRSRTKAERKGRDTTRRKERGKTDISARSDTVSFPSQPGTSQDVIG